MSNIRRCELSWYSIIADQATGIICKEQFDISIQCVDNECRISVDSIGLVSLPNKIASTFAGVRVQSISLNSVWLCIIHVIITKRFAKSSLSLLKRELNPRNVLFCSCVFVQWFSFNHSFGINQDPQLISID